MAQVRQVIGERLRARKDEIEQELLAGVEAFSRGEIDDPEYVDGLRRSVAAALDYGIAGIESSEHSRPSVPAVLYTQARLAARNCISLGTVTQRYIHGYTVLEQFADEIAEAEAQFGSAALKEMRRVGRAQFKCLIEAVSEQYERETLSQASSPESRLLRLTRRMLAGEPIDTSQFNYDFDGFHVGLVAKGPATATAIKGLANSLDCISMMVTISDVSTWAWLGRQRAPDINRVQELVAERWPSKSFLAIGEIGRGRTGWRLTHRQATAGLPVCLQRGGRFFRYGDDPVLVALLHDSLLSESFRQMYLTPLADERDGGEKLLRTLHAYCAAEHNGASAAKALKVSRQTVTNHLRTVEDRLGRSLSSCLAGLEATLRLHALDRLRQQRHPGCS